MTRAKREINMIEGPFLKKIVVFIVPLILTGFLQCLYNAADLMIVGHFRGEIALAAVGTTGALTNLIVGLFMGLSVGAGVVVAHYLGAMNQKGVERVVHSAISIAAILGVVVGAVGLWLAPQLLRLMDTPDTVLDAAVLYIRIVFLGIPAQMMYNYCASMLRSTGDTFRPLLFLSISGLVNVALNVILVALCGLGVEGVAIATAVAHYLSVIMILVYMHRSEGCMHVSFSRLRLDPHIIRKILYIGIPSGLQSSLFSLSNVMIQSSINGFGDVVMAGNTAASNLEGFIYIIMNAVSQASVTFVGQNVGAKRYGNIKRITWYTVFCVTALGLLSSGIVILFRRFFVGLYVSGNPEVMEIAIRRIFMILPYYFLCGIMEVLGGSLRGMGKSVTTMVISLLGACVFRILWVKTILPLFPVIDCVYLSYPISWFLVVVCSVIFLIFAYRRLVHPPLKGGGHSLTE